jgi:hypothetical protein
MATSKCEIDKTLNDYMLFCWYRGCWPDQIWFQVKDRFLYIAREINDAAIVWNEGIPNDE